MRSIVCLHHSVFISLTTFIPILQPCIQIFKRFDVSDRGMLTEEVRAHLATNQLLCNGLFLLPYSLAIYRSLYVVVLRVCTMSCILRAVWYYTKSSS